MNLNGAEYYYIRNAQGDITGLFDKTGAQVVGYNYDSWGKLISTTGTLAATAGVKNPYRYRGYRYDTETGLYYLQSRYYNSEWGRFVNADAIIGSLGELLGPNVFAYCKNNVVNGKDPSGFRPVYTQGDETEAMRSVSFAIMSETNKARENQQLSSSTIKAKLEKKGESNSVGQEHNKNGELTKERWFGPDGIAVRDKHYTDHGNSKQHPKVPHEHDWGWNDQGNWEPGPSYSMHSNDIGRDILIGLSSIEIGYLIYRSVRMIPSLFPPLWETIPLNVACP